MDYIGDYDLMIPVDHIDTEWRQWNRLGPQVCLHPIADSDWICTLRPDHHGHHVAHDPSGLVLQRDSVAPDLVLTEGL